MAAKKSCLWHVFILEGTLFFVSFAFKNEGPTLDMGRTRRQITTSLGQPANLGCYTTQVNSSYLKYVWRKGNVTVTPSSNIQVYGNLLVVTPKDDRDFGVFECHVIDGVSSTRCSISLRPGCNRTESEGCTSVVTGCVNLAVLMPVLAVMMASLLLNIHFLIQWRRRQRFLLSDEEIFQLQLAREALPAIPEEQEEENVEVKKKKLFGGRFKKCKKEEEDKNEKDHGNMQGNSKLDKDKGEAIEMQESKDFLHTQDGSRGFDIPREQDDSSREKQRPWEHDATRAEDNQSQEILRLDDILRVQETSTPAQDSMSELESPRSMDSARTKGIPRLEDILREQDSSLPMQDHSHELDSPRSLESPRTKEIPRLEEFLGASEVETKEKEHDETRPDVSGALRRSGSLQAPRIAEFFLPSDESDAERQSVTSEEPLVSHYMEKMDFEKGSEDEPGKEPLISHYMEKMDFEKGNEDNVQDEEPLVSHYMEKMDFEKGSEDNVQDEEPLVSHYMEKMDFEGSKNDEEPVLK